MVALGVLILELLLTHGADPFHNKRLTASRALRVHTELYATLSKTMAEKAAAEGGVGSALISPTLYTEKMGGFHVAQVQSQEYLLWLACLVESGVAMELIVAPASGEIMGLKNHIQAMTKDKTVSAASEALLYGMSALASC
jgi:hypothetical protein